MTIKSGHPHFMSSIDLLDARDAISKAIEMTEGKMTVLAVASIRQAQVKLAEASEKLFKEGRAQ